MSQCSCKLRRMFLAITSCILFSKLLVLTEAHSLKLVDTRICSSLNVAHGRDRDAESLNINVTVSLVRSGSQERHFCYETNTNYSINMETSKAITGLLIVQDQDKVYGKFANAEYFGHPPTGLTYGLCAPVPSISHECMSRCNLSTSLNFPYRSPKNKLYTLEFRYSVVFGYKKYHQNMNVQFPPCSENPTPPITTTTPAMPSTPTSKPILTCNASDYNVVQGETYGAKHSCPNSPKFFVKYHTITENDIAYNCTIEGKPIKKKTCGSGCLENGSAEVLCCRVRAMKESTQNWTCTAISSDVPEDRREIRRQLTMTRHRRCECFRCKDVCPTERSIEGNENSVDIDYQLQIEENSLTIDSDDSSR